MTTLSVMEHTRIQRGGTGDHTLPPHLFDRLQETDLRLAKHNNHDTILEWHPGYAKARQWVGVLQTRGLALEILPRASSLHEKHSLKRARQNLLTMLSYAGQVPLRAREMAPLSTQDHPLSTTLTAIFAQRLKQELLLGLPRDYETHQQNRRTLRGRLLMSRHVVQNAAHRERFYVSFDQLTPNTPLTQSLKAACRWLLSAVQEPAIEENLRHCLLCLRDVDDVHLTRQTLDSIRIDRRHERFRPIYELARMILAHQSPAASLGEHHTFTLLFDMNVVFERFVASFLEKHVMPRFAEHSMHAQARHQWRYLLKSARSQKGVLRLEPDILITDTYTDAPTLTLDTKWKLLNQRNRRRGVSREDMYQLFAYAQRYQCAHNILLYPRTDHAREEDFVSNEDKTPRTISVRFIDLQRDLSKERRALTNELTSLLDPILEDLDNLEI